MIGVRDIARHLLHVAEREGHLESKFKQASFEKLVFITLAYCLNYGIKVRYDIIFEKTSYGATSYDVKRIIGNDKLIKISFEGSKRCHQLEEIEELNDKLVNLVEVESKSPFSTVLYIVNSDAFVNSEYSELINKGMNNMDYKYKVMCRDRSVIWTLEDIYLFSGVEIKEDIDLKIPLSSREYDAVSKYISLKNKTSLDIKGRELFTFDEIMTLRCISDSIIESVEVNGAYIVN